MYMTLLEILMTSKGLNQREEAAMFVRELEETVKCDQKYDLRALRLSYSSEIGNEPMARIMNFEETPQDRSRCAHAVFQHRDVTRELLLDCLSIFDRIRFHYGRFTSKLG